MENPTLDQWELLERNYKLQAESSAARDQALLLTALADAHKKLSANPFDPDAYIEVAKLYRDHGRHEEAIAVLGKGTHTCVPHRRLWRKYLEMLEDCNQTNDAIEVARRAGSVFPEDFYWKLKERLLLPVVYKSEEEIEHYRQRYTGGLKELFDELSLDTPEAKREALFAIGKHVNFYLGYQAENDRDLQLDYGELVHRIMSANYPQWVRPCGIPTPSKDGRLRVGYVSSRFCHSSVTKTHAEWLLQHDQEQFVIYAYHVGRKIDAVTEQVNRKCQSFHHLPDSIEETAQAILSDHLQLLVYLDIGMHPVMSQLAALRLAPIQCVTWGHPITAGLPTLDYFISSELMEPVNAQDHYSEKLLCLPGVGTCLRKPVIPTILLNKNRQDFRLREDSVVYLCSQSVFKYLPEQDALFAEIARQVETCQFVFVRHNNARAEMVVSDFLRRLDHAFGAVGLKASEHCVILPEQNAFDYWNLNCVSDVFLDTLGWSGCNTTFEAIACHLPVVSLPGRLMRGRHSYAILTQLGVTDTIARDNTDYVDLAVRLGLDRQWRQAVIDQMVAGYPNLYSDTRSVRALENFYLRMAKEQFRS